MDVLKEVRRWQVEIDSARGLTLKYSPGTELHHALHTLNLKPADCRGFALSDDEPLYDSVASDDDYYILTEKDDVDNGCCGIRLNMILNFKTLCIYWKLLRNLLPMILKPFKTFSCVFTLSNY